MENKFDTIEKRLVSRRYIGKKQVIFKPNRILQDGIRTHRNFCIGGRLHCVLLRTHTENKAQL